MYVVGLVGEAEHYSGNMKALFDITFLVGITSQERPVKVKEGKTINRIDQQLNRWEEHFEEFLNRPALQNAPVIEPATSRPPHQM